jgi:hypothetical protein
MPRKPILVEEEYRVSDDEVRLSVLVGDRQYGTSMVFLDDELVANGVIDSLPVGSGTALIGRTISIYTVVTDVRNKKTEMSVTWVLTGGPKQLSVEKEATTSKGFGSQMFKAVFDFVEPQS